jgi:dUTP pyrophosphatase
MIIRFKYLSEWAIMPKRAHQGDAGLDLFATEDISVRPGEIQKVKTGIAIALGKGETGLFWGKSGLGAKGLLILGGCIDSDYRGELIVILTNVSKDVIVVPYGKAIVQLLIIHGAIVTNSTLLEFDFNENETERGTDGFGSSS